MTLAEAKKLFGNTVIRVSKVVDGYEVTFFEMPFEDTYVISNKEIKQIQKEQHDSN